MPTLPRATLALAALVSPQFQVARALLSRPAMQEQPLVHRASIPAMILGGATFALTLIFAVAKLLS